MNFLLFLLVLLQGTVAGFLILARLHRYAKHCGQVLRNYKCRHILFLPSGLP